MSIDPFNHPKDGTYTANSYNFCTSGELITAWIYLGLHAVDKLFNSIRLVTECGIAMGTTTEDVEVSYMKDDDTSWTAIATHFTTFSQEQDLVSGTPTVAGKRIRFKFNLKSHDGAYTPRILASVLEAMVRLPVKYATTLTFLIEDDALDMQGFPDEYTSHSTKLTALESMMNQAAPVTVTSIVTQLNGRTAFVDSINVSPMKVHIKTATGDREAYVGRMSLIEV